jgi:hydroxyacylglutathione hydrolase
MSVTPQSALTLEDGFTDILRKAQRGLHLTNEELLDRTGLSAETLQAVQYGSPDPGALEKLAFALHLHAPSLIKLAEGAWTPEPVSAIPGFAMFTTPFGSDMTVNAYLIWDPETGEAASFDTGSTCQPMLDYLLKFGLQLKKAFITHTHMDHLADLDTLLEETGATGYGSRVENPLGLQPLGQGDGFVLGCLRIRVLGTSGHTPGGLSYVVDGLNRSIVVVGDALFAGSMGGAPYAYAEALQNNQERILSLADDTVIAPGHGVLTTVGEEKTHNPFFPTLKPY